MEPWRALHDELDAWSRDGRTATLWWRDDDATRATPALRRLLALSGDTGTPVALAVIPRDIDGTLGAAIAEHPQAAALQHGWAHANHAPSDQRQEEYGPDRPRAAIVAELAEGWRRISRLPGALPAFVAPWNRMDDDLLPDLPSVGLAAVSTLGPRGTAEPAPGVRRTNVHVDIMDWQGGGFAGDGRAIEQVLDHLATRRCGDVDPDEPTGLMTHHGYHDEACWRFIEALLRTTHSHPAARWVTAREAFWP